jgi:UDP-glucose 6-dehydrogenase
MITVTDGRDDPCLDAFLATKISFINEIATICRPGSRHQKSPVWVMTAHRSQPRRHLGYGGSCLKDVTLAWPA